MKIPDAKAAVDKEWEKLETIASVAIEQGEEQNACHSGSTKRKQVHFGTLMDICHLLKNAELEPKVQRTSRAPW